MSKLAIVITEHLKLLFRPVIINAFLYYDGENRIKHENWGDDINYYFLREIINVPIVLYNRTSLAFRLRLRNYLVIGSTIDMLCKKNTEVWGAGIIDGNKPLSTKPCKVYAVRGPLTRRKLMAEGIECPEIYGDPALLIPYYYQPSVKQKYRYGIIAHVSNLRELEKMTFGGKSIRENKDILIINLGQYTHWHDIIDQICSCQAIISSSLHGLIMSEAYNIPNVWIEFGKPLIGEHFKFHDFFMSIHRDREKPVSIHKIDIPFAEIESEVAKWERGKIDLAPLIKACPFKLKKPKYTI